MNYLKVYCNLIRKAEDRTPPEGYVEKHHIFPKSIYGKNNRIVILSGREHYIAHALLEKICIKRYGMNDKRTKKMIYAHFLMKDGKRYFNSYLYDFVRTRVKEISKGKTGPTKGILHKEETKKKISVANKGKIPANKGIPHKEETKKKISAANKGRIAPNKDIPHTEETKKKIIQKLTGRKIPQEVVEKIANKLRGRKNSPHTEETKKKISAANKGRIAPNKDIPHTEETKKKISISNTGKTSYWKGKSIPKEAIEKMKLTKKMKGDNVGEKNPRAKTWKITFDNGKSEIVKALQTWAKENGYKPTSVRNLYNGRGVKKYKNIVSVEELSNQTTNPNKPGV